MKTSPDRAIMRRGYLFPQITRSSKIGQPFIHEDLCEHPPQRSEAKYCRNFCMFGDRCQMSNSDVVSSRRSPSESPVWNEQAWTLRSSET